MAQARAVASECPRRRGSMKFSRTLFAAALTLGLAAGSAVAQKKEV
jgi:hypothetical protein